MRSPVPISEGQNKNAGADDLSKPFHAPCTKKKCACTESVVPRDLHTLQPITPPTAPRHRTPHNARARTPRDARRPALRSLVPIFGAGRAAGTTRALGSGGAAGTAGGHFGMIAEAARLPLPGAMCSFGVVLALLVTSPTTHRVDRNSRGPRAKKKAAVALAMRRGKFK